MLFKFNPLVALVGVFAILVLASPQTPAQTTEAAEALVSYIQALETNPILMSLASELSTQPGAKSSIEAWQSSISSQVVHTQTPNANFLDSLPTEIQSFYGSVYTAEVSIISANGFTNVNLPTGTSTAGAAANTAAVGISGAALVGFVGVVMAL